MLQRKSATNFGRIAEDFATRLLQEKGYKVIERNFRSRFGEIDIISLKDNTLVFVEVKARSSLKFGLPEESVTPWKLRRIILTANYFSKIHPDFPQKMMIEVVALLINNGKVTSFKILTLN